MKSEFRPTTREHLELCILGSLLMQPWKFSEDAVKELEPRHFGRTRTKGLYMAILAKDEAKIAADYADLVYQAVYWTPTSLHLEWFIKRLLEEAGNE